MNEYLKKIKEENKIPFDNINKLDVGMKQYSNKKAVGILPNPLPIPLCLNLGCGNDIRNGFVNIDLFNEKSIELYLQIKNILAYKLQC